MNATGFHDGPYFKTLRGEAEFVWDGTNLTLRLTFGGHLDRATTAPIVIEGASGHFVDVHAKHGVALFHAHPVLWEALTDAYRHRKKGDGSYVIAPNNDRAESRAERDPEGAASEAPSTYYITLCPRCDEPVETVFDAERRRYEVRGQPIEVWWHRKCWEATTRERIA